MRDRVYGYRQVTVREKECIARYVNEVMKPIRHGHVRILVNNLDNEQEVTTILEGRDEVVSYVYDTLAVFSNMEFKVGALIIAMQQYNSSLICLLDVTGEVTEPELFYILERVIKIQAPLSKEELSTEHTSVAHIALSGW